jgi:hypothetical protein
MQRILFHGSKALNFPYTFITYSAITVQNTTCYNIQYIRCMCIVPALYSYDMEGISVLSDSQVSKYTAETLKEFS